ncbi:hypothetical protein [Paenarthrobacter sp. PH39-S1]|uniref:hypothetical protein n=1 Tax=Paenarthrobacter sp. PH39-S1 TaxID=3046204 RepID=UPI0024BA8874|nr:hypothetical protein [Paenarthrobacter sp. PH39-S1]MDJ0357528.1 hypothetical protein [Paenarthrobacter sp. PH39-S1]
MPTSSTAVRNAVEGLPLFSDAVDAAAAGHAGDLERDRVGGRPDRERRVNSAHAPLDRGVRTFIACWPAGS